MTVARKMGEDNLTSPTYFGPDRTYFGYQVLCRTALDVTMWWFWLVFFTSLHLFGVLYPGTWLLCFLPQCGCTLVGRGKDSRLECRGVCGTCTAL